MPAPGRKAQQWLVEIIVEGFGPDHRLWKAFLDGLRGRPDPRVHWTFLEAGSGTPKSGAMHAEVEADSPESAIHLARTLLVEVGHSVDPLERVFWNGARGNASRA